MIWITLVALVVAAAGAGLVRSASGPSRWLSLLLTLAFAIAVVVVDRTVLLPAERAARQVDLAHDSAAARQDLLRAAARVGPASDELLLRWRPDAIAAEQSGEPDPRRALGAMAVAPPGLPFSPGDVELRALSGLGTDRPLVFEVRIDAPPQADPTAIRGELLVASGPRTVHREVLELRQWAATSELPPMPAGRYRIEARFLVGEHEVEVAGSFELTEPTELLVVDAPLVAAALRVQGERVREVVTWPGDWRGHDRIVVGRALPLEDQRQLVAHVRDGAGLFVLAGGFGDPGDPLRDVLPVRPLPEPETGAGEGEGAGRDGGARGPDTASPEPPPDPQRQGAPPADERPDEQPPVGRTEAAGDISNEPVEVDKHAIAMVLVVDRSGTMGTRQPNGFTKMSYAKTSALRTAQALGPGDRVAIVTFGDRDAPRVELPMTDAADATAVAAAVGELRAFQESTWLLGGLRRAHELLRETKAAVKHVVVISDGEFYDEQLVLGREAFQMRSDSKVTVSIISIIDDSTDPGFKDKAGAVARDGGGGFIATASADTVPSIVSSEVRRVLSRVGRKPRRTADGEPDQASNEQPPAERSPPDARPPPPDPAPAERPEPQPARRLQVYAVVESDLLAPAPERWPTLGSAARSEAPLESRVLLVCGDDGWPLLAYANRGLGRVGVFAAGLDGADGREFREADAFPAWIAQWLAATAVARPLLEAPGLQREGRVAPPAPLPREIDWLTAVAGAPPGPEGTAMEPVVVERRAVVEQVAERAPWLILGVLLLALAERLLASRALRRGDA